MERDSTEQEEIDASSIPIELHMWNVDERLGTRSPAPVDTIYHLFQTVILQMDIMENITILVTWDRHVNHEYSLIGHRIHSLCLPIHILPLLFLLKK